MTLVLTFASAPFSQAGDLPPVDGVDFESTGAAAEEPTLTLTPDDMRQIIQKQARVESDYREHLRRQTDATVEGEATIAFAPLRYPAQERSYTCGPASAKMLVSAKVYWSSENYLIKRLGTSSRTGTSRAAIRSYLNNVLPFYYADQPVPFGRLSTSRLSTFRKRLISAANRKFGLLGNLHLDRDEIRPPGYPHVSGSRPILHHVAIKGCKSSGNTALVMDPAARGAAGSRYANVPRQWYMSTYRLLWNMGGKGYLW